MTALISGVLVGLGFLWISQSANYWVWIAGFGVLVGAGIAFGYSAATPAALKWYPPNRTGRITGIVVAVDRQERGSGNKTTLAELED